MSNQPTALTEGLYDYIRRHRSDAQDPLLEALRAETENLGEICRMSISPEQASFITVLVGAIGAKYAVEIGTFTGTSSIAIARGLIPGGKLTCFEFEFKWTSIARRYWMRAGLQDKIELKLGMASSFLPRFRPMGPIDFVFIDADNESYDFYYEMMLPHMRVGGLILFDNMLQEGRVIDPIERNVGPTRVIEQLNRKLSQDPRVEAVLLPIADGLFLCRKR